MNPIQYIVKICTGISSRNSEVVHAGIYYPPTSLKAKLCVEGRKMMYDYCSSRGIKINQCGKLVVATNSDQKNVELRRIYKRGLDSGVDDLQLLTPDDVKNMEPNVRCHGAIWSPSTGLVDSHSFMLSLLGDSEANGAMLALQSPVKHISLSYGSKTNRIAIETDDIELECENVVNAAGLFAAELFQGISNQDKVKSKKMRHYFAKGNYFRLEGQSSPFSRLIYPVPEPGGLGVHATIDLDGHCKFGPDVEWIKAYVTDSDDISLEVNPTRCNTFYAEVRKYWPDLKDGSLSPDCK